MWAGVCHTVPFADVRTLVKAGMAVPARNQPGRYDGLVFASSEYPTPALAVAALGGGPGPHAVSAAAATPVSFLATSAPVKECAPSPKERRGRRLGRR